MGQASLQAFATMKWLLIVIVFAQLAMWAAPEESPPLATEDPDASKDTSEAKSQLDNFKELMLKSKQNLKKKEEEVQARHNNILS